MITIKTTGYVGPDGMLVVTVPTPLRDMDVEVIIIVQPIAAETSVQTPEGHGPQGE